jgi:hypothetical protein
MGLDRRHSPKKPWRLALSLTLVLVGPLAVSTVAMTKPVRFSPDGLFYQATLLRIRGNSEGVVNRDVFSKDGLAAPYYSSERTNERRVSDPAWVRFSRRFYARRILLPLLGAFTYPLMGIRSLLFWSLAAYVAFVAAVWVWLLSRFRLALATIVAVGVGLFPPLVSFSRLPLTDSLALLTEVLGVLCISRIAKVNEFEGRRNLLAFAAIYVAAATARDAELPLLAGIAFVVVAYRSRTAIACLCSGLAFSGLKFWYWPAPWAEEMSYVIRGFTVGPTFKPALLARGYAHELKTMLLVDVQPFGWAGRSVGSRMGLVILVGGLVVAMKYHDRASRIPLSVIGGGVALLLILPQMSNLRLELILLPGAAFGWAYLLEALSAHFRPLRMEGKQLRTTPNHFLGRERRKNWPL